MRGPSLPSTLRALFLLSLVGLPMVLWDADNSLLITASIAAGLSLAWPAPTTAAPPVAGYHPGPAT
jgi:hypothetical protein